MNVKVAALEVELCYAYNYVYGEAFIHMPVDTSCRFCDFSNTETSSQPQSFGPTLRTKLSITNHLWESHGLNVCKENASKEKPCVVGSFRRAWSSLDCNFLPTSFARFMSQPEEIWHQSREIRLIHSTEAIGNSAKLIRP